MKDRVITTMENVREYGEEEKVELIELFEPNKFGEYKINEPRLCIGARTEGGCCGTIVDLLDVIQWVKENRPELLK